MFFAPNRGLLLGCCMAAAVAAPAGAAENTQVIVTGACGVRLRVEAVDPDIVRLWLKPAGDFSRAPSLATEPAPTTRVPLAVAGSEAATTVRTDALWISIDHRTLAFEVRPSADDPVLIPATTIATSVDGPGWTLTRSLAAGERILGLGQDNHHEGRLDRRGVIRELWAGQQINSGNVTAEYPVPLLIGLLADGRAYGMFFDNVHRLRFDLGATKADELRLDADGGEIDCYVIAGPKIADVIERYTRLTGRPSLPPLWTLGYWQSKCTYYDWHALDDAYEQLTARGFPVDAMVIDYDWPEVANNFQWAKRWFVNGRTPAERIAEYAKKGVKIVTSQSGPMIRQESPTFATGWAAGVFATDGAGNPVEAGYYGGKLLDFTSPKINDWLWPQVRARVRDGVAAWWLDLTEPEGEPPQAHYAGGRPADVHNAYSQLCTRSFEGAQLAETPDRRPFILTRTGSAGSQAHHAAVWTGDIYSDYATLRAHPPEMLNSSLSGLVWWTCDSGGFMEGYYRNDQMGAHARLYERWMQFSVFSPITRAHKAGGRPEPYQFGPAVEQSCLHYLRLRYRLLPYIYSYAWEASRTGLPLVRPLALEFQDDPQSRATPGDEYLFGRELLVAPALFEGQGNRPVYFPPGRWFDWDTGVEYAGGRTLVVAAPQNRIPVAVRAGAIIPLAPDMKNTAEKPWDPLVLEVFPAGKSDFTLYRDDGTTFGYQRGEFTVTQIASDASAREAVLTIDESNKKFTPATYVARFHLESTPTGVTAADGTKLAHEWSAGARVLTVTLPASAKETRHTIRVLLDGTPLAARPAPELKAQVIDPKGEAAGPGGKPVPHFYPPPALPGRIKAVNYDKGGEGAAFHSTRPLPEKTNYRPDDFAIVEGTDAGGGYVLGGMDASEWAGYTIDCGNGGWFDLTARVASAKGSGRIRVVALDQTIATIDVPATGGDDIWKDVTVSGVYLNPGELSLLLFVDQPGFCLNTLGFTRAARAPTVYPATRAARAGVAEIENGGGAGGRGAIRNFGRLGSSLTFGIVAPKAGDATLRLCYQNSTGKTLPFSAQVVPAPARPVALPPTNGEWHAFDIPVALQSGANAVTLRGLGDGWDSITLEQVELIVPLEPQIEKPPEPALPNTDASGNPLRRAPTGHVSNYDEAKVGTYTLPDPLVLRNGQPVRDADTWFKQRRPELLRLYEAEIYGRVPAHAPVMSAEVVETDPKAMDGLAVFKHVVVRFGGHPGGPAVNLHVYLPARVARPVPLLLHLVFSNLPPIPGESPAPSADGRPAPGEAGPIPDILARGYGYAVFRYTEIQPDAAHTSQAGVIGLALAHGQTAPAADEWGAISAWAWGASRILDYLATDPAIDARRVALVGHSRLGKTALWAGAQDPRFALIFASCAGEMGSALARRDYGETVDDMAAVFPWWFAGNFQKYAGHWNDMPVDAHLLISLCAPRPVFITGGTQDQWADPRGEFLAEVAAGPVYRLLGGKDPGTTELPPLDMPLISGDLGFLCHTGGHEITPADWNAFLDFADRHLQPVP
jgi:alpha-glucosidase